jgi:nicotinate-nucleotide adenylyltransferase
MHERIGIFGGTFDPPHLGSSHFASEAQDQLDLTRLLWTLTPGATTQTGSADYIY